MRMLLSKPTVKIGARGWLHPAWSGEFYPDDLPEDWRLTYYSNEFDSVLVPWEDLQGVHADEVQAWVDDARAGFEFFLELPLSASGERIDSLVAVLGSRLGGIIIKPTARDCLDPTLSKWLEKSRPRVPLAVDWQSLAADSPLHAQRRRLGCYWRAEQWNETQCHGEWAAVETGGAIRLEPKALKKLIEHCRSMQGPTTIALFFGGIPPRIEEIRNAIMILQMLG